MGLRRRCVGIEDSAAWVYNRMADVYAARPPYPVALLDAIAAQAPGRRALELGAGIGHVALPLAARGFDVTAVEPAVAMLAELERAAAQRGLPVQALHAKAEAVPFAAASFDLVVIADALHFLDTELVAAEVRRVLAPRGALVVVTCDFADTPFMAAVDALVAATAERRPRSITPALRQLGTLAHAPLHRAESYVDATSVEPDTLERILRSISFIGPAMSADRFAAFREQLHALPHEPVWSRRFTLYSGRRDRGRGEHRVRRRGGAGQPRA